MTWFKVDDQFPRHPKVLAAGTDAAWLFVAGGCYCAQYLTDGRIPKDALFGLTALRSPMKLAAKLVEVGLWHDHHGYWEVHDFLSYNPTREHVETERQKAAERRANGTRTSGERRATKVRRTGAPDPTRPDVLSEHLAPDKPTRKRDELFDAVCASCAIDVSELNQISRGPVNAAVKALKESGATPVEVPKRVQALKLRYPNAAVTAPSLAKHWASLGNGQSAPSRSIEEDRAEWAKLTEGEQ